MSDFESLTTTQKGNLGESFVDEKLFKQGFHLYAPTFKESHSFDRMVYSKKKDTYYLCDVKTKPARVHYPDTGIDEKFFKEYTKRSKQTGMEFLLIFVDETKKEIYGNLLSNLSTPHKVKHKGKELQYPLTQYGIVYFPLEKMKKIDDLTEEEAQLIKDKTTMNKVYVEHQNSESVETFKKGIGSNI